MTTNTIPAPAPDWYQITNRAEEDDAADVYIYDAIGGWFGVEASEFVRDLANLDVETIHLYVNSPGGSVYDGVAIMNAIRRHKARVIATVDGIAASAASFIIQAADEIVMNRGTELMIHDASAICWGNAEDMTTMATHLERLSTTIAELYADRAGGPVDNWRAAMAAETWYTAREAVEAGLADRVDGKQEATPDKDPENVFDLSIFAHHGRSHAPAPMMPAVHARTYRARPREQRPAKAFDRLVALAGPPTARPVDPTPPAEPVDTTEEGADPMSDKLMKGIRDRLGIAADADLTEDQALDALDEALGERAEDNVPTAQASTPPAGTVIVDAEEHRTLLADATEGRKAREQKVIDDRAALVDTAVNDGRIPPARREHWIAQLTADPGSEDTLANLAPGTIPTEPTGFTGGVDEAPDEDTLMYSKLYPTATPSKKD